MYTQYTSSPSSLVKIHYMEKSLWTPGHHIHMCFLNIQLQIYPHFTAIITYTILGRIEIFVKVNCSINGTQNATAYKHIWYECALPTLWQMFVKKPTCECHGQMSTNIWPFIISARGEAIAPQCGNLHCSIAKPVIAIAMCKSAFCVVVHNAYSNHTQATAIFLVKPLPQCCWGQTWHC